MQILVYGYRKDELEELKILFLDLQFPPWRRLTDKRIDQPLNACLDHSDPDISDETPLIPGRYLMMFRIRDPEFQWLRRVYTDRALPSVHWVLLQEAAVAQTFRDLSTGILREKVRVTHFESLRNT